MWISLLFYLMLCMTGLERIVIGLGCKERLHTFYLKLHLNAGGKTFDHTGQGYGYVLVSIHGCTDGSE